MIATPCVSLAALAASLFGSTVSAPSPTAAHVDEFVRRDAAAPPFVKRAASCTFPSPPKTSILSRPVTVTDAFDGTSKHRMYALETIDINDHTGGNIWFEHVCEGAITIKQSSGTSNIVGGGAKAASDNVMQHNGGGTVKIDSYCVQTFGKLYRSCGNCSTQYKRAVTISNIIGSSGSVLAGINSNYGDTATISTSTLKLTSVKSMCDTYQGNSSGDEPKKLTSNTANSYCKF
ncbi:hypothetical protein FRC09_009521 [Ceratobasidium sp. 395]|nr:hypothetical protein FRC09_009521 [Ceratobasidium sp. 395]